VGNRAVAAWVQASRPPCPGCGGCSCGKEGQAGRRPNGPDASGLPAVGLQRSIGQWFEEGVLAVESGLGVAGADCKLAVDRERDYIEDGVRGPEDLQAPTGIEGFGAQYDPASKKLTITLDGGVTFTDDITVEGGVVIPTPGLPVAVPAANAISLLPPDKRAAAVAPWHWAGDDEAWLAKFRSVVQSAWSEKFQFRCTKDYWTDLEANVEVEVHVHKGPKADNEHVSLTVFKVPDDVSAGVGVVNSRTGSPLDSTMTIASTDVAPRTDNLLMQDIRFTPSSDPLSSDGASDVTTIANTFKAGNPVCAMCGRMVPALEGPVLTIDVLGQGGADNAASCATRLKAIKAGLAAAGFVDVDARVRMGSSGVEAAADTVGATAVAEGGVAQAVAAHEAGHVFGLGDQYAVGAGSAITGTGLAAGGAAKHDQLAKDMGLPGSVAENNDNIMALGSVVRPEAYATFFWAETGERTVRLVPRPADSGALLRAGRAWRLPDGPTQCSDCGGVDGGSARSRHRRRLRAPRAANRTPAALLRPPHSHRRALRGDLGTSRSLAGRVPASPAGRPRTCAGDRGLWFLRLASGVHAGGDIDRRERRDLVRARRRSLRLSPLARCPGHHGARNRAFGAPVGRDPPASGGRLPRR